MINPATGKIDRRAGTVTQAFDVSPDGSQYLMQKGVYDPLGFAALEIHDVASGDLVRTLEGFCSNLSHGEDGCGDFPTMLFVFNAFRARWSPDGRWIAAADPSGDYAAAAAVWDAASGRLLPALRDPGAAPQDLVFSADSQRLLVTYTSSDVVAFDSASWKEVARSRVAIPGEAPLGLVGQTHDGLIVAISPYRQPTVRAELYLLDPESLRVVRSVPRASGTSIRAAAISPDGTRVALAGYDGTAIVWNLDSLAVVGEVNVGRQLQGVAWLDDARLALAMFTGTVVRPTRTSCLPRSVDPGARPDQHRVHDLRLRRRLPGLAGAAR